MNSNREIAISLAHEILNFWKDYDTYEFNDTVEDEEKEVEIIVRVLLGNDKKKKKDVLEYFEYMINENDGDISQSAKKILQKLNLLIHFED